MVLRGGLRPQAEIAWALLPRRVLPGSAAPSRWRGSPQFRQIRRDIEVAVVAGRGAQRRRRPRMNNASSVGNFFPQGHFVTFGPTVGPVPPAVGFISHREIL